MNSKAIEVLKAVANATFRPFGELDWNAFAGCETQNPMIAEYGDGLLLIDSENVVVVDADGMETQFRLELVSQS